MQAIFVEESERRRVLHLGTRISVSGAKLLILEIDDGIAKNNQVRFGQNYLAMTIGMGNHRRIEG
jgi:hypothetical protein